MKNTNTKKPFGITLASNKAAEAIRASVAPVSTVVHNLLLLQKSPIFPKELGVHDFALQKGVPNDQDKRVILKVIEALRSPHNSVAELLEGFVANGWVEKKPPLTAKPMAVENKRVVAKKPQKNKAKPVQKTPAVAPVIVIKKSRHGI